MQEFFSRLALTVLVVSISEANPNELSGDGSDWFRLLNVPSPNIPRQLQWRCQSYSPTVDDVAQKRKLVDDMAARSSLLRETKKLSDNSAPTKLMSNTAFQFIDQRKLEKDKRILGLVRSHVLRNTSLKKKRAKAPPMPEKIRDPIAKVTYNGQKNFYLVSPNQNDGVLIGGHDRVENASGDLGTLYSCKPYSNTFAAGLIYMLDSWMSSQAYDPVPFNKGQSSCN